MVRVTSLTPLVGIFCELEYLPRRGCSLAWRTNTTINQYWREGSDVKELTSLVALRLVVVCEVSSEVVPLLQGLRLGSENKSWRVGCTGKERRIPAWNDPAVD